MSKKSSTVKIGAIIKGKEGNLYIAVDKELKLNINGKLFTGKYLSIQTPEDKLNFLLEKGYITEEQHQEQVGKIPEFVKYEITAKVE